jgi:hypothetical protein
LSLTTLFRRGDTNPQPTILLILSTTPPLPALLHSRPVPSTAPRHALR